MTHPSAPGVKRRRRADGTVDWYWVATATRYEPRTVRLNYPDTPEGRLAMAAHARILQAEMLDWLANGPRRAATAKLGTIAWIVERYQTDEDSPYHDLRASTKVAYDASLAIITSTVGERGIFAVSGPDLRKWYREWTQEGTTPRRAYGCIQLLRIVLAYGTSLRDGPCRELRDILSAMQFEMPRKRRERMTAAQAAAIREAAHRRGRPEIALAVALMFELALRQKDVIGEWVRGGGQSGIVDGPGMREVPDPRFAPRHRVQWGWGLLWSHIDGNMVLRKPTSKSNGNETAEHDLRACPELLRELALVPIEQRVGPVIKAPSGLPYRAHEFQAQFRAAADAAGVPRTIWSMDARAGAISEAYEAGAAPADAMKFATHNQMATSMRYNRGALEQTTRVAQLRAAKRTK